MDRTRNYRLGDEASIASLNWTELGVNRDEVHSLSNCDWIRTHREYHFENSTYRFKFPLKLWITNEN